MNIIDKINKQLGKKVATDGGEQEKVETISTGLASLDLAIGGGFPKGRITVMKGLESTAKTSLALNFIAKCQKDGMKCAFVDAEYAFNPIHASIIGVDVDDLILIRTETGEEAFEAIELLLRDNAAQVVVIDSVSALTPRPEAEADYGVKTMGGQARLISQGMRKIVAPLSKSNAVLIFINQLRMNIMGGQWDPYTESGGMALKYYTSVAIKLSKGKSIMEGEDTKGITVRVKVTKNKIGAPFKECLLNYVFTDGWSDGTSPFALGLDKGIITKPKGQYLFCELPLGSSIEKAEEFVKTNPEIASAILDALQSKN